MAKKKAPKKQKQQALIVGVSSYPKPISSLPAVANDVKEVAKLLGSRKGVFKRDQVKLLNNRQAKKASIEAELRATLAGAKTSETVFVFFAGHGAVVNDDYFFIAHDTDVNDIASTGVPLSLIKKLFDRCKSKRAFLWLDFCHSGGIVARNLQDEVSLIERQLKVVQGEGKVIIAACTKEQSAYESSAIGHGFFTDALLRGLKGEAKSAQNEVTAGSLYDFIDHQVTNPRQQPVFSGEMKGRIVLMNYGSATAPKKAKVSPAKKKVSKKSAKSKSSTGSRSKQKGTWILLGDAFYCAANVKQSSEGRITVKVVPANGVQEAALKGLQGSRFRHSQIPFAVKNDGHHVTINEVEKEILGDEQTWTIALQPVQEQNSMGIEFSPNGMDVNEVARRRAGRILVNNPAPPEKTAHRGFGGEDSLVENAISGGMGSVNVTRCVIHEIYDEYGSEPHWKELARLKSVYILKATNTVAHILELKFGAFRGGRMKVTFKGQRPKRYSNKPAATIQIEEYCELS